MSLMFERFILAFLSFCLLVDGSSKRWGNLPVLLWHGIGDSCCFPFSIGRIKELIEKTKPEIYVHSVKIGNSIAEDVFNSYFKNINNQIDDVCKFLLSTTRFHKGYNAVGFSQGSQFLRGVAQRCSYPAMKNLISIGGQHQGIFGLPNCPGSGVYCEVVRLLISRGAYRRMVQNHVVPAEYWHDPFNEDLYVSNSIFLSDINNEKDNLGLQNMMSSGKLHFLSVDGDHLQFSTEWFTKEIIEAYL